MKRIALVAACAAAVAAPAQAAPVVRLTIVHVMRGCHVFTTAAKQLGASPTITVQRGTRLELRVNCPMDFDVTKPGGAVTRLYAGTTTTFAFPRRGTYVFVAHNVQAPEEVGLQTMGGVNTLKLRVRVI